MPSPAATEFDPQSANLPRFTERGELWRGSIPLSKLERLMQETPWEAGENASKTVIEWSLEGSTALIVGGAGAKEVWVRLRATTTLPMQCQRCLSAVPLPLQLDRKFRFVASESQAAALDEEAEEFDVLVSSQSFNFQELLEDELLMALPMSTAHDTCPTPAASTDPATPLAATPLSATKSNAFAALAALKPSAR